MDLKKILDKLLCGWHTDTIKWWNVCNNDVLEYLHYLLKDAMMNSHSSGEILS